MEIQAAPEVSRKRTASKSAPSEGGVKKQKLSNVRKITVPIHRLVNFYIKQYNEF